MNKQIQKTPQLGGEQEQPRSARPGPAPTNELLALEALLQPLRSHDVLHHRDGRQELHRARHLAGDEVGTLLCGLSNFPTQDVQLLKPQTHQKGKHMSADTETSSSTGLECLPQLHSRTGNANHKRKAQSTSNGCLGSQLHTNCQNKFSRNQ